MEGPAVDCGGGKQVVREGRRKVGEGWGSSQVPSAIDKGRRPEIGRAVCANSKGRK